MASTPTGRPRGRPKTRQYESLVVRVPSDLAEQARRYAARHRQSLSALLRDGLGWRIEQDTQAGHGARLWEFPETMTTSPLSQRTVRQKYRNSPPGCTRR
jgi:hypothetical protein